MGADSSKDVENQDSLLSNEEKQVAGNIYNRIKTESNFKVSYSITGLSSSLSQSKCQRFILLVATY